MRSSAWLSTNIHDTLFVSDCIAFRVVRDRSGTRFCPALPIASDHAGFARNDIRPSH